MDNKIGAPTNSHSHVQYDIRLQEVERRLNSMDQCNAKILDAVQEIKIMMIRHISEHAGGYGIWGKVVAYTLTAIVAMGFTIVSMWALDMLRLGGGQ